MLWYQSYAQASTGSEPVLHLHVMCFLIRGAAKSKCHSNTNHRQFLALEEEKSGTPLYSKTFNGFLDLSDREDQQMLTSFS